MRTSPLSSPGLVHHPRRRPCPRPGPWDAVLLSGSVHLPTPGKHHYSTYVAHTACVLLCVAWLTCVVSPGCGWHAALLHRRMMLPCIYTLLFTCWWPFGRVLPRGSCERGCGMRGVACRPLPGRSRSPGLHSRLGLRHPAVSRVSVFRERRDCLQRLHAPVPPAVRRAPMRPQHFSPVLLPWPS